MLFILSSLFLRASVSAKTDIADAPPPPLPGPVHVTDGDTTMEYSPTLDCLEGANTEWRGWTYGSGAEELCMKQCLVLEENCLYATTIFEEDSVSCLLFEDASQCEEGYGNHDRSYTYRKVEGPGIMEPLDTVIDGHQITYMNTLYCDSDDAAIKASMRYGQAEQCLEECASFLTACRVVTIDFLEERIECSYFTNTSTCMEISAELESDIDQQTYLVVPEEEVESSSSEEEEDMPELPPPVEGVNNGVQQMWYREGLHCYDGAITIWNGWKYGEGAETTCMKECLVVEKCKAATTYFYEDSVTCMLFANVKECTKEHHADIRAYTYVIRDYEPAPESDSESSEEPSESVEVEEAVEDVSQEPAEVIYKDTAPLGKSCDADQNLFWNMSYDPNDHQKCLDECTRNDDCAAVSIIEAGGTYAKNNFSYLGMMAKSLTGMEICMGHSSAQLGTANPSTLPSGHCLEKEVLVEPAVAPPTAVVEESESSSEEEEEAPKHEYTLEPRPKLSCELEAAYHSSAFEPVFSQAEAIEECSKKCLGCPRCKYMSVTATMTNSASSMSFSLVETQQCNLFADKKSCSKAGDAVTYVKKKVDAEECDTSKIAYGVRIVGKKVKQYKKKIANPCICEERCNEKGALFTYNNKTNQCFCIKEKDVASRKTNKNFMSTTE